MIITIDGPAGTGKTTVAKMVAKKLGLTYLDTGAMYRAITYGILAHKVPFEDEQALTSFLDAYPVHVHTKEGVQHYFLGQEDVTPHIRSKEVTSHVSLISSLKPIRQKLVLAQREFAAEAKDIVVEGRDMGTVVFPHAKPKIFLTATPVVRAKRRHLELVQKNEPQDFDVLLQEIMKRDTQDATRALSPMQPASDAIMIDSTELSIDEVVEEIVKRSQHRSKE
jgi:cytidylate kinase